MILLAYTHALRNSELCGLQWDQVNLEAKTVYVRRLKGSISGEHPLRGTEIRALKKLGPDRRGFVFVNERGEPVSKSSFQKIVARAGKESGLTVPIHPHMLRHSCGYRLINQGTDILMIQVWMGHANVRNTQEYTKLNTVRFKGLWSD